MVTAEQLITDNLDIWTSAINAKSSSGRGSSKKTELYGIKKLRELILELAIRGLLVPQSSSDTAAHHLLANIKAQKNELVLSGRIRKSKPHPEISEDEKPFFLPKGWEWARLGEIGHDHGQTTPTKSFTYIDVGSVNKELGIIESPSVLSASEAPSRARKIVHKGTVIYSTVRPYLLNVAVIQDDFEPMPIASTAFAIIHPFHGISPGYIYSFLRSPSFVSYVESVQTGIAYPAINDKQFFSGIIALPPEEEQLRIVAKVDELMALCDQLEQQTEASISAHQTLVETLLGALTNAPDHESLQQAWKRIAEHFDTLFNTEHSIDQLKQTILQLAVMGKLVPQDPNDEPARNLLKKNLAEKERLVNEGKIKKQKASPLISEDEKKFHLPSGWEWCRLQDAIDVRDGTHDSPQDSDSDNSYPLITSKNFVNGNIDFDGARKISEKDHLEISKRSHVEVDDILFSMIGGNIGNQVIVSDPRPFSIKNVALFKYYSKLTVSPKFLKIYTEELAIELQNEASGGAQPFISLGALRKLVFALPPIGEQHRIVEKVESLRTLIEQLKNRLELAKSSQLRLADAITEQAIA